MPKSEKGQAKPNDINGAVTSGSSLQKEDSKRESLLEAIEHAIHFLPSQGPLSSFVHHNTLHSFENLSFQEAVIEGHKLYGCEPYLSEHRYRDELQKGRISIEDLRNCLMEDLDDNADILVAAFGTRYTLRLAMLQMPLHSVPLSELTWLLSETSILTQFRDEVPAGRRQQMVTSVRRWINSNLDRNAATSPTETLPKPVQETLNELGRKNIASWGEHKWERFCLTSLWRVCVQGVSSAASHAGAAPQPVRHRDILLQSIGVDPDTWVNGRLISFCSAFLDQGLAAWKLPYRELGFAKSFAKLFATARWVDEPWTRSLQVDLRAINVSGHFDALASIEQSLQELGIDEASQPEFITKTLLSLRGWGGMVWQLEHNTPWLPRPAPQGSFLEFLAIRLLLDKHACKYAIRKYFGAQQNLSLNDLATSAKARYAPNQHATINALRAYTVFQLAQFCGWTPEQLIAMTIRQWECLLREIESFSELQRRRLFHLAYESRYRNNALSAIAVHTERRRDSRPSARKPPAYLAVFCIDDREESFRRHLEEVDVECETASAAGFFAVAMYYQGADHAHFRPLCPNVITPAHFVREEPLFSVVDSSKRRAEHRRQLGQLSHGVHTGSRTLVGGWLTAVFGAVATLPLVTRILAPRLTSRFRESLGTWIRPAATELIIERTAAKPGPEPEDALGYSIHEMATIVQRILEDIGWVKDLPPIVIFFGHGSSSLNNPHESAYNCGACSGGRGGPNARAFAMMANDPRVRQILTSKGLIIPVDVHFVGAYHNTCNDKVDYYDLDLLPRSHRSLFRRIEHSIVQARERNAHERSRRFESASLELTPHEALEHVEQRAEDLSQARPEYNHATNAAVIVGRREWSRSLFLDRRAFLASYDSRIDDANTSILARILAAAIPVCAGISLEYYFSTVDTEGYGCGSKLPHNVTSMIGVMTGAASDLRPGLSAQMVEIHEPMRILFVIETTPEAMLRIVESNEVIGKLVKGTWVQLAVIDPESSCIQQYRNGKFLPFEPNTENLTECKSSMDWYKGKRENVGFASIREGVSLHTEINAVTLDAAQPAGGPQ